MKLNPLAFIFWAFCTLVGYLIDGKQGAATALVMVLGFSLIVTIWHFQDVVAKKMKDYIIEGLKCVGTGILFFAAAATIASFLIYIMFLSKYVFPTLFLLVVCYAIGAVIRDHMNDASNNKEHG